MRNKLRLLPPLPVGEGTGIRRLVIYPLSLWERAGVRVPFASRPGPHPPSPSGRGDRNQTVGDLPPLPVGEGWGEGPVCLAAWPSPSPSPCGRGDRNDTVGDLPPLPVGEGWGEGPVCLAAWPSPSPSPSGRGDRNQMAGDYAQVSARGGEWEPDCVQNWCSYSIYTLRGLLEVFDGWDWRWDDRLGSDSAAAGSTVDPADGGAAFTVVAGLPGGSSAAALAPA